MNKNEQYRLRVEPQSAYAVSIEELAEALYASVEDSSVLMVPYNKVDRSQVELALSIYGWQTEGYSNLTSIEVEFAVREAQQLEARLDDYLATSRGAALSYLQTGSMLDLAVEHTAFSSYERYVARIVYLKQSYSI